MHYHAHEGCADTATIMNKSIAAAAEEAARKPVIEWDWDVEHEDRKREKKADAAIHGAAPFEVDRRVLKDVVQEKMGTEVGRIVFLSAGTFHKAYSILLVDGRELVARVARRFMPRLKTESEVATMHYLRTHTSIPVPDVYHHDANPYNRLGGEYILMSKAPGIPLSRVYHSMSHEELRKLLDNLAHLLIPLFGHRFSHLGSLYSGPPPQSSDLSSSARTPTAPAFQLSRSMTMTPANASSQSTPKPPSAEPAAKPDVHVGPIVSWPFFGSGRGDLAHPDEIDRGPWARTHAYLLSCAQREIAGVIRENEGKAAPHRLHLDPDEIVSSRHHRIRAVPGDASDESTEWDWEESEGEWEGPGDAMYRDYRRMQRSTFLVAHLVEREKRVREEMGRWVKMMEKLGIGGSDVPGGGAPDGKDGEVLEEFALDCHDMSLENVFVDENDPSRITCVIDWESTTTRPLWASAHVPAFLQSSPFTARLFRATVEDFAVDAAAKSSKITVPLVTPAGTIQREMDLASLANEWLHHEASGARLRMAHRCVEWDGWEEGLVQSILGPEDEEDEWFKNWQDATEDQTTNSGANVTVVDEEISPSSPTAASGSGSGSSSEDTKVGDKPLDKLSENFKRVNGVAVRVPLAAKVVAEEKEREKLLVPNGDICGGRGGELGRRLEAWLSSTSEGRRRLSDADEREPTQ
ncbi:hypothetical protein GLOTRDRAFT_116957 [Gloeophyllum trabeum ATCC 11539]|uniref:Aminoglycoside phosphotransferase domain-containing protein n=1 Tax=Gloeophyllum trabeum (strain ATCC 11539 / FP-39264 / Madison 617) TaxID=670483 RepID=S7RLK4_GLOTA|nr:uncharacterized protein GLOTRDRAFT_116957 [Gloeophyllum trabeum ATCC 11539]EPQ53549.1 hypothetical protein GLOTRDRAFT_116957 [Gloeophyllum trabeum ATCC 11539]